MEIFLNWLGDFLYDRVGKKRILWIPIIVIMLILLVFSFIELYNILGHQ